MKVSAYDAFLAALRNLIDAGDWGIQARLAKAVGRSARHINDVYKGRKGAGLDLQEAIAEFFGMSYEEMVARGREMLGKQTQSEAVEPPLPFQDKLDLVGHHNKLAARLIYDEVAAELGFASFATAIIEGIGFYPPGWEDYLAKRISDYRFYEIVKEFIEGEVGRYKK